MSQQNVTAGEAGTLVAAESFLGGIFGLAPGQSAETPAPAETTPPDTS